MVQTAWGATATAALFNPCPLPDEVRAVYRRLRNQAYQLPQLIDQGRGHTLGNHRSRWPLKSAK